MTNTDGNGPTRGAIYARVSTRGQAERGYSLRQQEEKCREVAESKGISIVDVFVDDGYSAGSLDRPEMGRCREAVRSGALDVLVAQDGDRISRDRVDYALLEMEFEEHGCKLWALDEPDDDSAEGDLSKEIRRAVKSWERRKFAERSQRNRLQKAKEGKILPSRLPNYGFAYNADKSGYVVNAETMPTVRRVFGLLANGATLYSVADALDSEGVPVPDHRPDKANKWSTKVLKRFVLDPVYEPHDRDDLDELVREGVLRREVADRAPIPCGVWFFNRRSTETVAKKRLGQSTRDRSAWVAVPVANAEIPRETVERARENVANNSKPAGGEDQRVWELSGGVMFCGSCGRRMSTHSSSYARKRTNDRAERSYYRCQQSARYPDLCPNRKHLNAENTERAVWGFVRDYLANPERVVGQIDALIAGERAKLDGDNAAETQRWIRAVRDLEQQDEALQRAALDGIISGAGIDEKILSARRDELAVQRQAAQRNLKLSRERNERVERLEALRAFYAEPDEAMHNLIERARARAGDEIPADVWDEAERDALAEWERGGYVERGRRRALDEYTPEERHREYRRLQMRVECDEGGDLTLTGLFGSGVGLSLGHCEPPTNTP